MRADRPDDDATREAPDEDGLPDEALAARYRDLLSRQLVANEEAWAALVASGLDEQAPFVLEFAFTASDPGAADALARTLAAETDYAVDTVPADDGTPTILVLGATRPTALSVEILDQWVDWMVTTGLDADCDFLGWTTAA
jgi:Regulator of ribonuclease activity B